MANNRMYLVNKTTGERRYIAKYYPSTGWYMEASAAEIDSIFHASDFRHLTDAQLEAGWDRLSGIHKSKGGAWGEAWTLEYEIEPTAAHPPA